MCWFRNKNVKNLKNFTSTNNEIRQLNLHKVANEIRWVGLKCRLAKMDPVVKVITMFFYFFIKFESYYTFFGKEIVHIGRVI